MTHALSSPDPAADPDEGWSLPAWLYSDPEYFEVEMARVLRPAWQVVCHVSDIAAAGDFHTLDFLGESVIVVRGEDDRVRAFANVCRHRASRLLAGPSGRVDRIVCPYHAWSYGLDGRLGGVPMGETYPGLDLGRHSLAALDLEIFHGFVFVRLQGGGPSVAQMMAPYAHEIAPYRFEDLKALGRVTLRPREVNWRTSPTTMPTACTSASPTRA